MKVMITSKTTIIPTPRALLSLSLTLTCLHNAVDALSLLVVLTSTADADFVVGAVELT